MQNHSIVNTPLYTSKEERANVVTHGIGMVLCVPGIIALLVVAIGSNDPWQIVGFSIFGLSLAMVYFSSTLYHLVCDQKLKKKLRVYDHSAIFVLIAGSYTPFLLIHLRGPLGWSMMGIIWGLALVGIFIKAVYGVRFRKLSLGLYILMGWLCVFAFREMYASIPSLSFHLLVMGGLLYTLGIVFYNKRDMNYHHAIWHVFVLGGSICHYFSVLLSV